MCLAIRSNDDEATRQNHSPDFKAKVALAALKGDRTIAQLSDQHGVHVSQITAWKDQLQASAANVFGPGGATPAAPVVDLKALHAKIGELNRPGFVGGSNS